MAELLSEMVYGGDFGQYAADSGLVAFVHFRRICDGRVDAVQVRSRLWDGESKV